MASFPAHTTAQVDEKLTRARAAFVHYRNTSSGSRAAWLNQAADLLDTRSEKYGRVLAHEMGKTLASAIAEVQKCAAGCHYFAEHAAAMLAETPVAMPTGRAVVQYQPLGVVLAIMPWNFPFWQVFRFAAPTLMAGNVAVLKHAPNVPQCAIALDEIFLEAGFPAGVFQSLLLENDQAAQVIADPRISAITLTGSTRAGSAVAQQAGSLLKKTVLELGGSDPFLVLPSADLDAAVAAAVKSRTLNNGQSCIAAKRFIIHEDVYEAFEPRFVAAMRALKVGDPMNAATDIGPLVSAAARDNLARQVEEAITAGARILTGAHALPGKGFFFEPTVLADLPTTAPVYREEFFGPVALLFRASSLDAAIALANNTSYGLGATVFTRNIEEQEHCIAEIEAGQVFINEIVASDPRLPFGGVKQSGYGRELATEGIREFTNIKTVRWA